MGNMATVGKSGNGHDTLIPDGPSGKQNTRTGRVTCGIRVICALTRFSRGYSLPPDFVSPAAPSSINRGRIRP